MSDLLPCLIVVDVNGLADYEGCYVAGALTASKRSFDSAITALRFIITRAVPLVLQFRYRKVPLFWIPHGWFPYYVEWVLGLPKAPIGSVGIQIWSMACSSMIQLAGDLVVASWALVVGKTQSKASVKAHAFAGPGSLPASRDTSTSKKEL